MNSGAHPSSQAPAESRSLAATGKKKPRIAILLATAFGLGYIPIAPGTFGSFAGVLLALLPFQLLKAASTTGVQSLVLGGISIDPLLAIQGALAIVVALAGVSVSSSAALHWQKKDPQRVVIDEVSGQHLALLLGSALPVWWRPEAMSWAPRGIGFITYQSALTWKYLLLGFILFRVFDIWKPFPARQAESLPVGWGIMADDWMAGVYAGLCLWAARGFGL